MHSEWLQYFVGYPMPLNTILKIPLKIHGGRRRLSVRQYLVLMMEETVDQFLNPSRIAEDLAVSRRLRPTAVPCLAIVRCRSERRIHGAAPALGCRRDDRSPETKRLFPPNAMNKAVDKPQLAHHRRGEDKRVEVGLANAMVEAVDCVGDR